jgi:hypothetical protein
MGLPFQRSRLWEHYMLLLARTEAQYAQGLKPAMGSLLYFEEGNTLLFYISTELKYGTPGKVHACCSTPLFPNADRNAYRCHPGIARAPSYCLQLDFWDRQD